MREYGGSAKRKKRCTLRKCTKFVSIIDLVSGHVINPPVSLFPEPSATQLAQYQCSIGSNGRLMENRVSVGLLLDEDTVRFSFSPLQHASSDSVGESTR